MRKRKKPRSEKPDEPTMNLYGVGTQQPTIQIGLKTGKVTMPEGMELDEAAKLFWDAVEKIGAVRLKDSTAQGRSGDTLAQIKDILSSVTRLREAGYDSGIIADLETKARAILALL